MARERWDSYPTYASQDFLVNALSSHRHVERVEKLSPNRYVVHRRSGEIVHLFLTDVYEFTTSDLAELLVAYPETNAIVSASNWNHFTTQAEIEARNRGVGTFTIGGVMGALNFVGETFVRYEAPD